MFLVGCWIFEPVPPTVGYHISVQRFAETLIPPQTLIDVAPKEKTVIPDR